MRTFRFVLLLPLLLGRAAPAIADEVIDPVPASASSVEAPEASPPAEPPTTEPPTHEAAVEPEKPAPPQYVPPTPAELARLTEEEREIYRRGEMRFGLHEVGVTAAIFVGFGLGHVVQGRWLERGWIFTLGQTLGTIGTIYGHDRAKRECPVGERCTSTGVKIYVGGMIALIGFYAGGILDAWIVPSRRSRQLREVHRKLRAMRVAPYLVPTPSEGGGGGGISFAF